MKRRALLIGGSGQLGTELWRQGEHGWDITAPSRTRLDAFDAQALSAAVEASLPDLIVNCSAFHVVDLCETRFADALAVNALAVSVLAKAAERIDARFVTVSTDYAFDGAGRIPYLESDAANPIQAYGISKVAGERAALSAHPEGAFVIRSCGLYGHAPSRQKSGNFVLARLADATTKRIIEVGSDLVCTPTSAADLADGILNLLENGAAPGLYHLTNSGSCDWATFTAEIYRTASVSSQVVGVNRGGSYAPARRPAYSVLDCSKAEAASVSLRPWQEALADYVSAIV
ncbi:MAG: dTDP-4-dehydrorhamnose reductase [Alphaproteobacteria bacterium]|nr:MAG: dTDP-4-dehydrorhamnose reductase [Alphaproteobacteria bacterium]PZO40278.1 MAG: dTDP-4-dehydrorhamnose reductase [Alphaproteobacteria bacterium]